MDLIYMNNAKEDIGVLTGYTFDLAYGNDENDFTCIVDLSNHVCREGYILYIEETEYGGIIDNITVDTEKKEIMYSGRTWHGVLEKKVIEPDLGYDYLEVSGDANDILRELIERMEVGGLFCVADRKSEIIIDSYEIRYERGYSGIRKMLKWYDGKLCATFKRGRVEVSAVPIIDYSQDEGFDVSQVNFKISKNYRPINHLICLGSGNLRERHVIHIYADENGGVQSYAKNKNPIRDEDYILNDRSKQRMFGEDEVADVYDYPNAQDTVNYVNLQTKPENWETAFTEYYKKVCVDGKEEYKNLEVQQVEVYTPQDSAPPDWSTSFGNYYISLDGKYEKVEAEGSTDVYTLQTSKPNDWSTNFGDYYIFLNGKYEKVESVVTRNYLLLHEKPSGWGKKYEEYFTKYSDGTKYEWKGVEGETRYTYECQTLKPSDWSTNFGNYFMRKAKGGYETIQGIGENKKTAPVWKAKKYYTRFSKSVAPVWKKNTYYICVSVESLPNWVSGKYYCKTCVESPPAWTYGKYYSKENIGVIPTWQPLTYYEETVDHYADLVKGGLEFIEESFECDSIEVDFDGRMKYDIGDIVGAYEQVTGIEVWQPISKKIVTLNEKQEIVKYQIGE